MALSLCSIVSAFAQGAVVGYAAGGDWIGNPQTPQYTTTTFPTQAQLQKLTHVIASDIGVKTDDSGVYEGLWIGKLPNQTGVWNGTTPIPWLVSLVSRAHAEGVKVIICVGGGKDEHVHWDIATNNTYRNAFVADIKKFVEVHNLDGVDIDWENMNKDSNNDTISGTPLINRWTQCIALLNDLMTAIPCKRISIALPLSPPTTSSYYANATIPEQIWNAVHAIQLMTYDEGISSTWPTHSYASSANNAITAWATWGTPNGLDKKMLFVACAFYGWYPAVGGNRIPYATYIGGTGNPGDKIVDVQSKVNHCYSNGYGGVFIWELGYDENPSTTPTLLNAIWTANTTSPNNGYPNVAITTQPAATTTVVQGSISGSLSVATNKPCSEVIFQWYKNAINSNAGGSAIPGATGSSFQIPTTTTGTYYYYCEISGKNSIKSSVATVTVTPPCTAPTLIYTTTLPANSGQTNINHGGNIIIQNVTVNNGVTLNVVSCGDITINNVTVVPGGNLILDAAGEVVINEIDVQLGAEFEIK